MNRYLFLIVFSIFISLSCFSQVKLNKSEHFKQYPDLRRIEYLRLDNLPEDELYQDYLIEQLKKEIPELIRFQIFLDNSSCLIEYNESSSALDLNAFISEINIILDDTEAFEQALASGIFPISNNFMGGLREDLSLGGGDDCNNATAFCSDDTYVYNNKVNPSAIPSGPMYGCVCRLLNPSWFYMQIEEAGDLIFNISQTSGDVDFVCWGPFNNISCDPHDIADFKRPDILDCLINSLPNNWNGLGAGTIVDCAYSPDNEETLTIFNAQVGQYYLLAIANYSNIPGQITFSQTNLNDESPGKTFCNAVSDCVLTSLTTDVICDSSGATISISGEINHSPFADGGTGSIEICVGSVCQTINGPFSASIPYVLNNVPFTESASLTEIIAKYTPLEGNPCFKHANFLMPDCEVSLSAEFTLSEIDCHDATTNLVFTGNSLPASVFNWDFDGATVVSGHGQGPYVLSFPSSGCKTISLNLVYEDSLGNLISENSQKTIIVPTEISSTISTEPSLCYGSNNGKANVEVQGGTPDYSYSWGEASASTSEIANDLSSGTYSITITDSNGCKHINSFTITQAEFLEASATIISPILCYGESTTIEVSAIGGTMPYTGVGEFEKFLAGEHTFTVTDANECSSEVSILVEQPEALSASISIVEPIKCFGEQAMVEIIAQGGVLPYTGTGQFELSAGEYNFEVNDANTCTSSVSILIDQALDILIEYEKTDQVCSNLGSVELNVSGGSEPYSYEWPAGLNFSGSNVSGLSAGNYVVSVRDVNNCISSLSIDIEDVGEINSSSSLLSEIKCNGGDDGSVELFINGGSSPYIISWGAGLNQSITIDENSGHVTGLSAGVYTFLFEDQNKCMSESIVEITEPEPLLADLVLKSPILCYGESTTIEVSAIGGTMPYIGVGEFEELIAGDHTYTVTDANECSSEVSILIEQPEALSASISIVEPINCFGQKASIQIDAEGGFPPYSGTGIFAVDKGEYSYEITDANGCKVSSDLVYVDEPSKLHAKVEIIEAIKCFGELASINVSASGGSPDYINVGTYSVDAGIHSYQVVDSKGCVADASIEVTEPKKIIITANIINNPCNYDQKGKINLDVQGGLQPYNYSWTPYYEGGNAIYGLSDGTYAVIVSDKNNCLAKDSYIISSPERLSMDYSIIDVLCYGEAQGKVNITASGGILPYEYKISSNLASKKGNSFENLYAGKYIIRVIDANNCFVSENISIEQVPEIMTSYEIVHPSCRGNKDGEIIFNLIGGLPPYLFKWDHNTSHSNHITGLNSAKYIFSVIDANNCEKIIKPEIVLTENPIDCLVIPNAFTPNGDGINDEWIIENLELFPNASVRVYNRWGQELWRGGCNDKWDGRYRGNKVPCATYTYTISLFNGSDDLSGLVSVVY